MQDHDPTVSFCLSFNSYSSDRLSAIADKVSEEERKNPDGNVSEKRNQNDNGSYHGDEEDEDDDFEFVLVRTNYDDCITIGGGKNHEMTASYPVFPLFNRDLLLDFENDNQSKNQDHDEDAVESAIRLPLRKLFIEGRDPPSSSSSEADELEGITAGTYCVWTPAKSPSPLPSRCKKSNSTGTSSKQKWRLRDLLHLRRCSSDGKESFILFNAENNDNKGVSWYSNSISKNPNHQNNTSKLKLVDKSDTSNVKLEKKKEAMGKAGKGKDKMSAHEVFYIRSKAAKADKRRSYLPYRQGLVGFFADVNGLGKTLPPF